MIYQSEGFKDVAMIFAFLIIGVLTMLWSMVANFEVIDYEHTFGGPNRTILLVGMFIVSFFLFAAIYLAFSKDREESFSMLMSFTALMFIVAAWSISFFFSREDRNVSLYIGVVMVVLSLYLFVKTLGTVPIVTSVGLLITLVGLAYMEYYNYVATFHPMKKNAPVIPPEPITEKT